jgi:hypothetical protein
VAEALKHASLATFAKPEAAAELMGQGNLDVLAMWRDALVDLSKTLPGSRLLDGAVRSTAMGEPDNRFCGERHSSVRDSATSGPCANSPSELALFSGMFFAVLGGMAGTVPKRHRTDLHWFHPV